MNLYGNHMWTSKKFIYINIEWLTTTSPYEATGNTQYTINGAYEIYVHIYGGGGGLYNGQHLQQELDIAYILHMIQYMSEFSYNTLAFFNILPLNPIDLNLPFFKIEKFLITNMKIFKRIKRNKIPLLFFTLLK